MAMDQEPGKFRCPWCLGFEQYMEYHDEEWGVPVFDDQKQFEFLVLESAQAGLSWSTILKKRGGYQKAFADFDYSIVADLPDGYVQELLIDSGIIRNEMKIRAAINNAKRFMEIQTSHGSFKNYIWNFVDSKPVQNQFKSMSDVPATSLISDKLAKDMKSKGFKFLGSTILYAHMQATGLVNDHLVDCFRHEQVRDLGK
ncbi:DNA-3-methyladenine glycosylase I [Aquiflexum sp. LQ15W]|uniref:DNA-3-methyladenine glycosylase I n=1 Tax=Cognataquiflexum nitidum TaxID=2922272 RepID=UPI001F149054|nr:DNA-3-methyladenine glycosylase I [Cognataquiflexum nitidum]MCH6200551.1 DNA-3-methyladenine glycosylase I [Cognataquiflexum nitidum]